MARRTNGLDSHNSSAVTLSGRITNDQARTISRYLSRNKTALISERLKNNRWQMLNIPIVSLPPACCPLEHATHLEDFLGLQITISTLSKGGELARFLRRRSGGVDLPEIHLSSNGPSRASSPSVDPNVCAGATQTILTALTTLRNESTTSSTNGKLQEPPLFVFISSICVATDYRDFSPLMYPFYRWLLNVPVADKRSAHTAMVAAAQSASSKEGRGPLLRFVSVHPSLLNDGPGKGLAKVRVGIGRDEIMGYSIDRNDVGAWTYEEYVERKIQAGLVNNIVKLTY